MRKRNATIVPFVIAGAALVFTGTLVYFLLSASPFVSATAGRPGYPEMPVEAFVNEPKTYAGNKYRFEGTISNILDSREDPAGGGIIRLASIETAPGQVLPLLVKAESAEFALQRGQSLIVWCEIDFTGLPVAESIDKK